MHLAAISRHPPKPRLLKAKLLFNHPKGVLHFGGDVSLGCFDQVEQSAF